MEAKRLLLANDNLYFRGVPPFVVAEIQEWPLLVTFAFGLFLNWFSYGTTIYTCWKVLKKLKSQEADFSPATKKLHSQMTRIMILQAFVPLFLVSIPTSIALSATILRINVPGLGMIANLICRWIPVANPLVTIISVKEYRRTIISVFQKCFLLNRWQPNVSVVPSTTGA